MAGLRSPQLLSPPGQREEARDSKAGLFWRREAPGRAEARSDTSLQLASLKGPGGEQPPAGRPEKLSAPGESGRLAGLRRGTWGSLSGSLPSAARGAVTGRVLEGKGKKAAAGKATTHPRTHPPRPPSQELRCASGGARSLAPSLPCPSTAGLLAGLVGSPGMSRSGMVAEWPFSQDQRKSWG